MGFFVSKEDANALELMLPIVVGINRGLLDCVCLDFKVVETKLAMTATVTDSYRLGQQFFVFKDAEIEGDFRILVNAKGLLETLKKVRGNNVMTNFDITPEKLTVTILRDGTSTVTELKGQDGQYPKFESFFKDEAEAISHNAFNPIYLSEIPKLMGASKTVNGNVPLRVFSYGSDKPAHFIRMENGRVTARALLMPVRV